MFYTYPDKFIRDQSMWAERSVNISAHRSAPFTGVPLTAPFPLRRPIAPLTLHLIFWNPLTAPLLSFEFLTRSAPLRSKAGFRRGGGVRAIPTNRGPPLHPLIFFLDFTQLGIHEWFLISYRSTNNNMIIGLLSKVLSYKIKMHSFYSLPPTDVIRYPNPNPNPGSATSEIWHCCHGKIVRSASYRPESRLYVCLEMKENACQCKAMCSQ